VVKKGELGRLRRNENNASGRIVQRISRIDGYDDALRRVGAPRYSTAPRRSFLAFLGTDWSP